ncbi:hypothetical protein LSCM1_07327 [Leishmania martiniquensis]|uniref:Serine/threonine-protein phosphatase n=1 Tax=Leishmania martiniquensis TaxID=1580590 RepID=A0A836GQA1_9TRYP|nr:hypothetical protein LSCM1_07327 [Leishmania martiniquensis]
MNALTRDERRDDYLQRFALRELVEHWLDRASLERPEDPYQYLIDEALAQRRSGGGIVSCPNSWCNMTMPASQFETHQKSCNNASSWVRCVRCNMRVDVSKMSHHRLYCRLERCALCGEVVLPRMLLMCPYRLISEAERDRQAAMHRLERCREGVQLGPEAEAASLAEAATAPTLLSPPQSPKRAMMSAVNSFVSRGDTRRASSATPTAPLQGAVAPPSLPPTERRTTRTAASGDHERSAVPSASASQSAITARSADASASSSDAATAPLLATCSGCTLGASGSILSSSTTRSLTCPSTSAALESTLVMRTSSGGNERDPPHQLDSESHSGSQTAMLSASATAGRRPSFGALGAADSGLRDQLDRYPNHLLPAIRSLQRRWRRNFFVHLFRKEVLGGVWRQLDSAQEKAAGKNAYGIANRIVDRRLREQCHSCSQDMASGANGVGRDGGGCADRGVGLRSSSVLSVPADDLVGDETISASFEADPVAVSHEELESGGYMGACDLEALTRHLAAREVLPLSLVLKIVRAASKLLGKRPVVQHLSIPASGSLVVVGDIHGQMKDLEHILCFMGPPTAERYYLFNGDFIDRGPYGCEVLVYIFSLLCTYPDYVFLNRGNHENYSTNTEYGFMAELYAKYGARSSYLLSAMVDSYECMPLLSIVDHRVAVVHGGAPRLMCTLDEIEAIGHVRDIPVERQTTRAEQLLAELLWNDPVEKFRSRQLGTSQQGPGWRSSSRGCGVEYLSNITEQFLKRNGLTLLIRSHDVKTAGFELAHRNKSITVFSASNYGGVSGNRGAVAVLTRKSAQPVFHTWFLREDYRQLRAEALLSEEENASSMTALPRHNDAADVCSGDTLDGLGSNKIDLNAVLATPPSAPPSAGFVPIVPQKLISVTHVTDSALMMDDEFIQAYYLHSDFVLPEAEDIMSVPSGGCSRASALSDAGRTSAESISAMACISADKRLRALLPQPLAPSLPKQSKPDSGSANARGWRAIQGLPDSGGPWRAAQSATASSTSRDALQAHRGTMASISSHFSHCSAQPMARIGLGLSQDLSIALQLQTIQQIRELVYFNRYALLAAFNQVDEMRTGTVYKAEWCVVTRDVLKLDIPWYYLCQHLVPRLEVNGVPSVEYMRFLRHFDARFALESRLSWQRATILRISADLDIPEDIINTFCDRSMKAVSSASSQVHSTGGGLSQNSSLHSPLPTILSPATVSLTVSAAALTDSPRSAVSSLALGSTPPASTLSPLLPPRSLSSPIPSATTLLAAAALPPATANAARWDGDDAESAAHARPASEAERHALLQSGAPSSDDSWWHEVQIGFNMFANKVRALSPAAAAMEDNEVFALFCYFDVGMQGHVRVGDIVRRTTELLQESGEEEAMLLMSGELDFSAIPGGPPRGAAAGPPAMSSLSSLSTSSPSSATDVDVGDGKQGATASGAPEADAGNGGGGGGELAPPPGKRSSRATNSGLARFGKGGLAAKCHVTRCGGGAGGSSAVDGTASDSSSDTGRRCAGNPVEHTSGPGEAKKMMKWPASIGGRGTPHRKSTLDGAIGDHGDKEPGSSLVRYSPSATKRSLPSSVPRKISRQLRTTLPTPAMVLPFEPEDDGRRRSSQQVHAAAAGEASGEVSMDLSCGASKSGLSSLAFAADRSSTHAAGVAHTVALPRLQAGRSTGRPAEGSGGSARKSTESSLTVMFGVPKPPSSEVKREPSVLGHDVPTYRQPSCASDSALSVSKPFDDYCGPGDFDGRLAFDAAGGSGVSATDSDTFRPHCSSQEHSMQHQQPPRQQRAPSLRSKHLATPPWIFSALLRVQEQLLGGHSRLRLLFAALNQSKNGRLSEKEFVSLIQFMNLLLEHPLSDEQARELFHFVHESAINCVQSMLNRQQRASAAGPLGRKRGHHAGSTMWGDVRRMPGDIHLSVSPMLAGASCEADTQAYAQSRLQAELQRGGAYILLIEFMAFFGVRPVPHGEEVTATEELLRTGTASATSGGAEATRSSTTAPSALTMSLSGDLASSHHQQLQGCRSTVPRCQPPDADSSEGPMVPGEGAATSVDRSSLAMQPAIGSLEAPAIVHVGGSHVGGAGERLSNAAKATANLGPPSCDLLHRRLVGSKGDPDQIRGASAVPQRPRELLLTPSATGGGMLRGPGRISFLSLSTAEQELSASAEDRGGAPPPAHLLLRPAESVRSASAMLTESTKEAIALPSSSLASWGSLLNSLDATPVTLTTHTTDLLSVLAELRNVYGEHATLRELLQKLSSSLLPTSHPEATASHSQTPLCGTSTSLSLLTGHSCPRNSCSLAALGGVATRAAGSPQQPPDLAVSGAPRLSAAPTSAVAPAVHLSSVISAGACHEEAVVATQSHHLAQNCGIRLEGEVASLLVPNSLPGGAGPRRRTVRSHSGCEGDTGAPYSPRVPNPPAVWIAADSTVWRFSTRLEPSITSTTRPYMLNQPTELRVTRMAVHSCSLLPIPLDVPLPSEPLMAAHITELGNGSTSTSVVTAGSRGCPRRYFHGHDRRSRQRLSSVSRAKQPLESKWLPMPLAPYMTTTLAQRPRACTFEVLGSAAFSNSSSSDAFVGSRVATSANMHLPGSGSDEAGKGCACEGGGGGIAAPTYENASDKNVARGEPFIRSGQGLGLGRCAERPPPQTDERVAPSTPETPSAIPNSLPRAKSAASALSLKQSQPLPKAVTPPQPRGVALANAPAAVNASDPQRSAAAASMPLLSPCHVTTPSQRASAAPKGEPSLPAAAPAMASTPPSLDRPLRPQPRPPKENEALAGPANGTRVALAPAVAMPAFPAPGWMGSKAAAAVIPAPPPMRTMPCMTVATSISSFAEADPSLPASPHSGAQRAASGPLSHDSSQPTGAVSLAPVPYRADSAEVSEVLAAKHASSIVIGVSAAAGDATANCRDAGSFISLSSSFATRLSNTGTLPPIVPSQPPSGSTSAMNSNVWLTTPTSTDQLPSLQASHPQGSAVFNLPDAFVLAAPGARTPAEALVCCINKDSSEIVSSTQTVAMSATSQTSTGGLEGTAVPARPAKGIGAGGVLRSRRHGEESTSRAFGDAAKRIGKDEVSLTMTTPPLSSVQAVPPHPCATAPASAANTVPTTPITWERLPALSSDTEASTATQQTVLTASTNTAADAGAAAALTGGISMRESKAKTARIPAAAAAESSTAPLEVEGRHTLAQSTRKDAGKTRPPRSSGAREQEGASSPPSVTPKPRAKADSGHAGNGVAEDVMAKAATAACTLAPPPPPLPPATIAPSVAGKVQTPVTTPDPVSVKRGLAARARDLPWRGTAWTSTGGAM